MWHHFFNKTQFGKIETTYYPGQKHPHSFWNQVDKWEEDRGTACAALHLESSKDHLANSFHSEKNLSETWEHYETETPGAKLSNFGR